MKTELIKKNEMIAEWMQLKRLSDTKWINPVLAQKTDHLAYHESFGWIMPVVEKICRLRVGDGITFYDYCYPRTFGMLNAETGQIMVRLNGNPLFEADTLIEAIWLAVTYFIEHESNLYNKQPAANASN